MGCLDATLNGYAVHEAEWTMAQVQAAGRWSERWRFKLARGGRVAPRSTAAARTQAAAGGSLGVLNLDDEDLLLGAPDAPPAGPAELEARGWELDTTFPELDPVALQAAWHLIQTRPNRCVAPTHVNVLRAMLFGLRRRLRVASSHRLRHLILCDN